MKILVISPPLILKSYRARWENLAKLTTHHILALVPKKKEAQGYRKSFTISTEEVQNGNFALKTVETTSEENHKYRIKHFHRILRSFQPDVIFCVHQEGILQLLQTIIYRKIFSRRSKLVYFTMTAFPRVPKRTSFHPKEFAKTIYFSSAWWLVRHGTDGALCHNDIIEAQMRKECYTKPVLQQTQYGVNPMQFRADQAAGESLRKTLRLRGCVIGFCGRFVPGKGIYEIMEAFSAIQSECSLLLVGDGELRPEIEKWVRINGFADRVHITGYVPHHEVQNYFQAMDIFVLGHRRATTYFDNFPLVVAQAMTVGLPVVGANGGGIPYQLGGKGLLFEERSSDQLKKHLEDLIQDEEKRLTIGRNLRERALEYFCVDSMNETFINFIKKEILE